jgi:hypothetical protein
MQSQLWRILPWRLSAIGGAYFIRLEREQDKS